MAKEGLYPKVVIRRCFGEVGYHRRVSSTDNKFIFQLLILQEVAMKRLILYVDRMGCLLTGKTPNRLKNRAHWQWPGAITDTAEAKQGMLTVIKLQKEAELPKIPTDLDIALIQEQYRYFRYTTTVGRGTRMIRRVGVK
jgi:hypothetical protein